MASISLGDLINWGLREFREKYNIDVDKYSNIIKSIPESAIQVSTFEEFYQNYDSYLNCIKHHLTEDEYYKLINNKNVLCGVILELFNQIV